MPLRTKLSVCAAALLIVATLACDRSENEPGKQPFESKQQESITDVTLTNEISVGTEIEVVQFKMKGRLARADNQDGITSSIHDPEKGVTILDHRNKTYKIVPLDLPDNSKMSAELTAKLADSVKMRFTGRKAKIGKLDCEEFLFWDSMSNYEYPIELQTRIVAWIAKDLKGGAEIQAMKEKVAPSQLVQWLKKSTSKDHFGFPGFAVRIETSQKGQFHPMVNTCIKMSFDPLDAKEFSIPSNYTAAL